MDLDGRTRQYTSPSFPTEHCVCSLPRTFFDFTARHPSSAIREEKPFSFNRSDNTEKNCRVLPSRSILETVNEVHSDMEPPEAPEQESTQGGIPLG